MITIRRRIYKNDYKVREIRTITNDYIVVNLLIIDKEEKKQYFDLKNQNVESIVRLLCDDFGYVLVFDSDIDKEEKLKYVV